MNKEKSLNQNGFYLNVKTPNNLGKKIGNTIWNLYTGKFIVRHYDNRSPLCRLGGYLGGHYEDILAPWAAYQYMRIKGEKCYVNSADKSNLVPIYDGICIKEKVTRNVYGLELSRYCVEYGYKKVPTGLYTTKDLSTAYEKRRKVRIEEFFSNPFNYYLGTFSVWDSSRSKRIKAFAKEITEDIKYLLEVNGCNSKAIQRFEDNLIRYLNGDPPLTLNYEYAR